MSIIRWIGSRPDGVKTWPTKGVAKKDGAISPKRVAFNFECVWCDCFDGILLQDGRRAPTHEAHLYTHGHVMGLRDMGATDFMLPIDPDLVNGWRSSFSATDDQRGVAVNNQRNEP